MDEFVGFILQALFELSAECLWYYLFDTPRSRSGRKDDGFAGWLALFFVVGCGLGGVLTSLHPRLLLAHSWLRIANLLLAPLLSGWLSLHIARLRRRNDWDIVPHKHFWYAAVFTFGFAAVRFVFGQR